MTAEDEKRCRECELSASAEIGGAEAMLICNYRTRYGKRRPCGSGKACTVYEERRRENA